MIRIDRQSMRVWLLGRRVHHGAVGVILILIGTLLAAHDRRDLREWFTGGGG